MGIRSSFQLYRYPVSGFHSINIPSEWGYFPRYRRSYWQALVSIQLISPASGDNAYRDIPKSRCHIVSIQLISPASGDRSRKRSRYYQRGKVSIQLISPASGDSNASFQKRKDENSFHSINIPSEWGSRGLEKIKIAQITKYVSIQLISPASGDS